MNAGWAIFGALVVIAATMGGIAVSVSNISTNLYAIKLELERLNTKTGYGRGR